MDTFSKFVAPQRLKQAEQEKTKMIRTGKIVAAHGLHGAVIMTHIAADSKWMKKGLALMVEMQKGSYIPYFVAECKTTSPKEFILNLEELDKVDNAKKLVGKSVYVDETVLAAYAKISPLLWIGFTVTDVHKGLLGPMDDVMQTPNQWLGKITIDGKEVLIPLIDNFIKDVNIKSKRLIMELPAGLIDVYL